MAFPQVRLASAEDRGAEVYNCYHLLSQLLALYTEAAQHDPHLETRGDWAEFAEQCVEDIGELFAIWEVVAQSPKLPIRLIGDDRLHADVRSACLRTAVLVRTLNVWVPFDRWARILVLLERKWIRLATRLEGGVGEQATRLVRLRQRASGRDQRVLDVRDRYREEARNLDANYVASRILLKKGGLPGT